MKWILHQYKRVHRLRALEGEGHKSSAVLAALECQLEMIVEDYHNWLDTLAYYSINNGVTITINSADIEDANVFDPDQTGAATFDEEVEWVTEKAPALLVILKKHAKDRSDGVVLREQLDKDSLIQVSPSLDDSISISPKTALNAVTPRNVIRTVDSAFCPAHAQVTAAIGSRSLVLNPPQLSETESDTIPDESGPEEPFADTANEQIEHATEEEEKIEEDPSWIDSPENRFILSLGKEEERELIEAMTRSPLETKCEVE